MNRMFFFLLWPISTQGYGNAPEYETKIEALLNISHRQHFIEDSWEIPLTESNPSMADWTLDTDSTTHLRLIVSCNRIYRTELLKFF